MASAERVLKFTRSDDGSRYVLLNVVFKGPKPLDIRIQATEGEAEYAVDSEFTLTLAWSPASDDSRLQSSTARSAP